MSPRPRFTSRIDHVRNAVLGLLLKPFRWFSPKTQFVIGFACLSILTTLVFASWPLTFRALIDFLVINVVYFFVWRFVRYRAASVDLLISKERVFGLVGAALLFQTVVIRFSFIVT